MNWHRNTEKAACLNQLQKAPGKSFMQNMSVIRQNPKLFTETSWVQHVFSNQIIFRLQSLTRNLVLARSDKSKAALTNDGWMSRTHSTAKARNKVYLTVKTLGLAHLTTFIFSLHEWNLLIFSADKSACKYMLMMAIPCALYFSIWAVGCEHECEARSVSDSEQIMNTMESFKKK